MSPIYYFALLAFIVIFFLVAIVALAFRLPIPMILFCPGCGHQHIDRGEWATKRHRKHLCEKCGQIWKPAPVATVGVENLPE